MKILHESLRNSALRRISFQQIDSYYWPLKNWIALWHKHCSLEFVLKITIVFVCYLQSNQLQLIGAEKQFYFENTVEYDIFVWNSYMWNFALLLHWSIAAEVPCIRDFKSKTSNPVWSTSQFIEFVERISITDTRAMQLNLRARMSPFSWPQISAFTFCLPCSYYPILLRDYCAGLYLLPALRFALSIRVSRKILTS